MNKDNVLNVMEQTRQKHARFLATWKRGVASLGPELFGPGILEGAQDKDELKPLPDKVDAVFAGESGGEEQFLAAMVSFYDPPWGERLAARIDCFKSVSGLTYNPDHECTEILAELLLNYEEW